jgi:NAD(P)-dependent dehydrogenase (short-subunit alcohol dehydrogenase family)
MLDFTGHVVLVTGAAAGIGFGIASAFHAAGARVALGDLRPDALDRAASKLGAGVFAQPLDVRDEKSVAAFVTAAEKALGPVTVGVANAGIYPNTAVIDMSVEEWDRVMETNVRGVFVTCKALARGFIARGTGGRIITIASGAASSGRRGAAHYCASKAGVVMFTKVLAMELAEHAITANVIAPGLVSVSEGTSSVSEEYFRTLVSNIPMGRAGTPDDIARAALFLASPLAEWITGAVLQVDGGSSTGRTYLPFSTPPSR